MQIDRSPSPGKKLDAKSIMEWFDSKIYIAIILERGRKKIGLIVGNQQSNGFLGKQFAKFRACAHHALLNQ